MDKDQILKDALKPFNSVIQTCPVCGKLDVYKDDGHSCQDEITRQLNSDFYDG